MRKKLAAAIAGLIALTASNVANAGIYSFSGAVATFMVGQSGFYGITAVGATGGGTIENQGGAGALAFGDLFLTAGTVLELVVGGAGNFRAGGSGGGGGSFVYFDLAHPLLIAGGGGGSGTFDPGFGAPAGSGGGAGSIGGGSGGVAGAGGSGGSGVNAGGGGAGFFSDGAGGNGMAAGAGGNHSTYAGGAGGQGRGNIGAFGAFGGGGGGGNEGGGGGGGYSGGGGGGGDGNGGGGGGGGGSFASSEFLPASISFADSFNGSGDGYIDIELVQAVDVVPEPASIAIFGLGLVALAGVRRKRGKQASRSGVSR